MQLPRETRSILKEEKGYKRNLCVATTLNTMSSQKPPTALQIRMAMIKRILIRPRGRRDEGVDKIGFPFWPFPFPFPLSQGRSK